MIQFVRKYPFSILCFLTIWYLSFFTPPETELEEVPFIDKWVHIIMYGGSCTVLWIEYLRKHTLLNKSKLFLLAFLAPILMSGIIELLQEYCTNHRRSGDWLDLAANSTGVTLAVGIGLLLAYLKVFNKHPRHDSLR
ncbi:MAG: VanZ family protein [Prevotella sp.]|nr:VanZ family protein [Prevotella sp.]